MKNTIKYRNNYYTFYFPNIKFGYSEKTSPSKILLRRYDHFSKVHKMVPPSNRAW